MFARLFYKLLSPLLRGLKIFFKFYALLSLVLESWWIFHFFFLFLKRAGKIIQNSFLCILHIRKALSREEESFSRSEKWIVFITEQKGRERERLEKNQLLKHYQWKAFDKGKKRAKEREPGDIRLRLITLVFRYWRWLRMCYFPPARFFFCTRKYLLLRDTCIKLPRCSINYFLL